jgi:hypothetical protein
VSAQSLAVAAGACLLGLASGGVAKDRAAATPALTWERAFPVARAAPDVHLDATFSGADGKQHRLELWRHGKSYLHRKTDETLDLYVVATRDREYAYRFFDHKRHVVTGVRRDNLYRIGVFSDWFGLAHVVDRPKTAFELRSTAEPHPEAPRRDCAWRELVTGAGESRTVARVCWSARWGTALAIEQRDASGAFHETFAVRSAEPARFARGETALPPTPPAYAFVDADQEIAPQAGD